MNRGARGEEVVGEFGREEVKEMGGPGCGK